MMAGWSEFEMGLAALALAGLLCAMRYVARMEGEFGRILPREEQERMEAWERAVELGMRREWVEVAAQLWSAATVALLAMVFAGLVTDRAGAISGASSAAWSSAWSIDAAVQWGIALLLTVAVCGEALPRVMMERMRGDGLVWAAWLLRLLLLVMIPAVMVVTFLQSVASLTEAQTDGEREDEAGDVEALLEAGEEEGILEEQDRQLVRSALEFGDKLVKEVMTPRSAVFAVPEAMLFRDFVEALGGENYSRVPVYRQTLDEVTGIAFARDMLPLTDAEKAERTVGSLARAAALVPETKPGYELLREMQQEKQHMRIVIDEYGEVAGVVTIEDLLEEIVGTIRDEHEEDAESAEEEAAAEADGSWLVPGGFASERLTELVGADCVEEPYASQTVGGLVTEIADRIPLAGEVVEAGRVRMEIVKASERRVELVRVRRREEAVSELTAASDETENREQ